LPKELLMTPPLISIVIANYNYAHFIPKAIESVLSQDDPNFELIVVDNASTDTSWEVIGSYAAVDERLRAFRNESNIGIVRNHNRGLREARGSYVMFLSADDFFLPGHLRTLRAILAENPTCDVAYTNAYACDINGIPFGIRAMMGEPWVDTAVPRDDLGHLMAACYLCLPTMLIPMRYFDESGPLDEAFNIAFDWEIALRMAFAGARFATRRSPTVSVRFHETQASSEGNYYKNGRDLFESLALLEKFVTPENAARLRVAAPTFLNIFGMKTSWLNDPENASDQNASYRKRIALVQENVRAIAGQGPFARRDEPHVAVIVLSGGHFHLLYEAIASLAAQTYTNWHAYVVRETGFDQRALLATIAGFDERVSYIDAHGFTGQCARLLAADLIDGDLVAYLDEDNTWAPSHLALAVAALRTSGAHAVSSRSRLCIDHIVNQRRQTLARNDELFRGERNEGGQFVGCAVPLNAVVHDRIAFAGMSHFACASRIIEEWAFLLQLQQFGEVAAIDETTVDVHAHLALENQSLAGTIGLYGQLLEEIYARTPMPDERIRVGRANQRTLAAGLPDIFARAGGTPQGVFDIYSVVTGALAMRQIPS